MVQDTAWEGYEKIPVWIMQGYGTMASEAAEQLEDAGIGRTTHIFIRRVSAVWLAPFRDILQIAFRIVNRRWLSWKHRRQIACIAGQRQLTVRLASYTEICKRSWLVWPVASQTRFHGIS